MPHEPAGSPEGPAGQRSQWPHAQPVFRWPTSPVHTNQSQSAGTGNNPTCLWVDTVCADGRCYSWTESSKQPPTGTQGHRPCAPSMEQSRKGKAIKGHNGVAVVGLRGLHKRLRGALGGNRRSMSWHVLAGDETAHVSELTHMYT